ncbi:family 43 glycosylhydrolase [Stieleria varia]|uniref:Extracellular exo-alpha-(1->5)-L-arabinofuranosidase n=1 Tax=Stieleria varia TaxID=2528005 RepID=A0A5C6BAA1_9BACT|nr:family 43 glycosylhydrolase [Stieleria varia]TWU08209.1 Extracellular exo-alpha-(1->5)-L-arabinofuranosidase precursor [Stieleria varia]
MPVDRRFLFVLCILASLLGFTSPLASAAAADTQVAGAKRPNIVMVFIDDMGWSDVSCFGGTVQTQHIDQLAAEGIRFTNFYVNSPICSPSRVALTTGQYPHRWRITSYLNNRRSNKQRGVAQWLDPSAPLLARELQKSGYATGHFGKWHMGGQRDVDDAPAISTYGFDDSLTNFEGMGAKLLPLTLVPGQDPAKPGRIWEDAERLGDPVTWMQRSEITTGFVDGALEFMDKAREDNKPFFVNLWPDDVHGPLFPPLAKWGEGKRKLYQGVLDAMDEQLARLFDYVRNDETLRNNTLIVFCSDNGHEDGAGNSDPLRGAKTWLYEGGIRSPLIVWGPGLLNPDAAGTTNDESIFAAIDINRSLYTIAGIEPTQQLDGEDLSATMLGKEKARRVAPIFWRRPPDRPGNGHGMDEDNPDLAVRDGQWKYLVNYDGSDPQLYNLDTDAPESNNVAAQHPDVVKRLDQAIQQWNAEMPFDAGDPRFAAVGDLPPNSFVNPIGEGADPWVIRDPNHDRYLWCFSEGNRAIAIHTSDRLTSLGEKHIIWRAPDTGMYSNEIWAPELHYLNDRWVVYFAASDGRNENHQAWALQSKTSDPLGEYELHGPLATGDEPDKNIWAIDMTPLQHNGKLYTIWSGWDAPGTDQQFLYIAEMKSPVEMAGTRVRICSNDQFPWEFTEENRQGRGLNEGPQVLKHDGRTFVTFSCAASWLPTYKLGLLELTGNDPLDPASWKKFPKPAFRSTQSTYGVGHSCFVKSPDAKEWWHVFHAKRDRDPGWRRAIFVQPFGFRRNGVPDFGQPVSADEPLIRPSGEKPPLSMTEPFHSDLRSGGFDYYGHHQFYSITDDGLAMGRPPEAPINAYRSGEKILLDSLAPDDFTASVTLDFGGSSKGRGAGLLFRLTAPSVGYDAHRGYFVGVKPSENAVLMGKMDGAHWRELKRTSLNIDTTKPQRLTVSAAGPVFTIGVNGDDVMSVTDETYKHGAIGLRTVDIPTVFSNLTLETLKTLDGVSVR